MKIETKNHHLKTNGISERQSFKVELSAKAFEIIAGLYTVPIKAVLRELSTNSVDAMIEANRGDIPVEVWLPSWASPEFKIKDSGIGMSKHKVFNLYTTLFASDKNYTNDLTGGYGIGRASCFSLTRSFNLTCIYDGIKTLYTVFLNEDDIPEVAEFSSIETDERNGTEVSFGVRTEDIGDFFTYAQEIFSHFNVHPIVHNSKFKPKTKKYDYRTDNFGLRQSDGEGCVVIMGGICYEIPKDDLNIRNGSPEYYLLEKDVDLFFTVNDVSITPNRESLKATPKTSKAIKAKIETVIKELNEMLLKEHLKGVNTYWDFSATLNSLRNSFGRLFTAYETETFNGKKAVSTLDRPKDYEGSMLDCHSTYFDKNRNAQNSKTTRIHVNKNTTIFVKESDDKKAGRKFYYNACLVNAKTSPTGYSYLVDSDNPLLAEIDQPSIIKQLKDGANAPKMDRAYSCMSRKRDQINVCLRKFWESDEFWSIDKFSKIDVKQDRTTLYSLAIRRHVDTDLSVGQMRRAYIDGFLNKDDHQVVIIKPVEKGKIVDQPNWITPKEYLKGVITPKLEAKKQAVADYLYLATNSDKINLLVKLNNKLANANPLIKKLVESWKTLKSLERLASWTAALDFSPPPPTMAIELEAVFTAYPFLHFVNEYCLEDKEQRKFVLSTISLIDRK